MATRSFAEIQNDLITYILRQNQKIDVSPGQVFRDVSINAPASIMEALYGENDTVRNAQSILNASTMSTKQLDDLVANFGVTRKTATPSIGTVIFYTPNQPVSDIEIPVGSQVATTASNNNPQTVFTTSQTVRFLAAFESSYYNPQTGYWEIPVNIKSQDSGTNNNVGPFTINQILTDLPFQVTNRKSSSGATDQESNVDLATRTVNSFQGNNKGTRTGYLGTALIQPNVLDALVQGPGDPFMVRDGGQGGKVDVWCLTSSLSATELTPSTNADLFIEWNLQEQSLSNFNFIFPSLPVDVDASMLLIASVGPANPQENVVMYEKQNPAPSGLAYIGEGEWHYTFHKANDLDTAHSVLASDYIQWNPTTIEELRTYPSGLNTNNTLNISIYYSYDKTVTDLQTVFDEPSNKIITADVLAKAAIKVTIDVEASVNLDPAYKTTTNVETQTINSIITAVTDSVNTVKMGTKLEKSDIVQTIHNVAGVDNVLLNSIILTRSINPIYGIEPSQVENTQALANEYLAAGTVTINSVANS